MVALALVRVAGLLLSLSYLVTHISVVRHNVIVRDNRRTETHQQITIADGAITIVVVLAVAVIVGYLLIARGLAGKKSWAPRTLLVLSAVQILLAAAPRANPYPTSVRIIGLIGALLCVATVLLLLVPAAGRRLLLPTTPGTAGIVDPDGTGPTHAHPGLIPKWATFPLTIVVILVLVPAQAHAPLWRQLLIWALLLGFLGLGIWYQAYLKRH